MEAESAKESADGEISHIPKNSRAVVYVDGFNLHYGISAMKQPRLKWLDIGKLGATLAKGGKCAVKYFTAPINYTPENPEHMKNKRWQTLYHSALAAACPSLEFIEGTFHRRSTRCPACGRYDDKFECRFCGARETIYQEKQTDVNLAFHLAKDFFAGAFERAFVVSGDSDLTLPVSAIAAASGREIFVVSPPRRKNDELAKQANGHLRITPARLRQCLLPIPVVSGKGRKIFPPQE